MRYALAMVVFLGCGPKLGKELEQSKLDKVVLGTTTWGEVQNMFGPPLNLMDSTNSPASGYFSKGCGVENDPIKIAQYTHVDGDRHSSHQFLIDPKGIVCDVKKSGGALPQ